MPPKRCLSERSGRLFFSALYYTIAAFAANRRALVFEVAAVFYLVGYNNITLSQGTTYKGPQFVSIGRAGKMLDFAVSGYNDFVIDAQYVTVSKINAAGVNYKNLIWLDIPDEMDPSVKMFYGWYQWDGINDPIDCNEDPLEAGECLMVDAQDTAAGWQLVSSGEVAIDGVAYTLVNGTQYLACAIPRTSTYGEIEVSGYGDFVIDAQYVTASKINAAGINYKNLIWLDIPDEMDPSAKMFFGWYEWDGINDPIDCNADELAAGDGLMVNAQDAAVGWTITFPKAIAD